MTAWLSYWNAETRQRNKRRLTGQVVSSIYVPWGYSLIKRGDIIYCFFVKRGRVHLITRLTAAKLSGPDPHETVDITPSDADRVSADFTRVVPVKDLPAIEYLHKDRKPGRSLANPDARRFQGLNSVRELTSGTKQLDALLNLGP